MNLVFLIMLALSVVLTVGFTEAVKVLDRKQRFKKWRVWVPLLLAVFFAAFLWKGAFFAPRMIWFWTTVIFGVSVFCYEAIIKKIKNHFIERHAID